MAVSNKLIIRSSEWLRGGKGGRSLLLNENNSMCCMGIHVIRKCRVAKDNARFKPFPVMALSYKSEAQRRVIFKYKEFQGVAENSSLMRILANINDDPDTSDDQKIEAIAPLFKKHFDLEVDWRPNE